MTRLAEALERANAKRPAPQPEIAEPPAPDLPAAQPVPEAAEPAPLALVTSKPSLVKPAAVPAVPATPEPPAPSAAPPRAERPAPGKELVTTKAHRSSRGSASSTLLRPPAEIADDAPIHADPKLAGKLVGTPGMPFGCTEQYRKLAATLHHIQVERGIKVLMVSSAVASEGKTLTSTNIALTLSESYGKKVLIIDADLRRPTLHQIFNLPNLTGLSDALRSEKERTLPLTQVASRLSALTAGRPEPDPMGGLTSPRMRRIIEEAAAVFDWVIIDTPPAGLLPDAKLITQLAEAAILVIRAGRAPVQLVMQAVEALGRERIVGVVLNGVDSKDSNAAPYYGGYGGYYGYGGYEQPNRARRD